MSRRDRRIAVLNKYFKKAEEYLEKGYDVRWDGEHVVYFEWTNGLDLDHGNYCYSGIYNVNGEFEDMADLTVDEIKKQIKERLEIYKKVSVF